MRGRNGQTRNVGKEEEEEEEESGMSAIVNNVGRKQNYRSSFRLRDLSAG